MIVYKSFRVVLFERQGQRDISRKREQIGQLKDILS